MDRNLVESILGRPFIKIAHLVPFHLQTWPPQAILIFDRFISNKNFSKAALPNEPKHGSEYPCKIFYKDCSLSSDLLTWPPKEILVSYRLISKKSSSLKPLCQMNRNMVGSIFGKSSIKIVHLVPIC
jgi:hypothetical protein